VIHEARDLSEAAQEENADLRRLWSDFTALKQKAINFEVHFPWSWQSKLHFWTISISRPQAESD